MQAPLNSALGRLVGGAQASMIALAISCVALAALSAVYGGFSELPGSPTPRCTSRSAAADRRPVRRQHRVHRPRARRRLTAATISGSSPSPRDDRFASRSAATAAKSRGSPSHSAQPDRVTSSPGATSCGAQPAAASPAALRRRAGACARRAHAAAPASTSARPTARRLGQDAEAVHAPAPAVEAADQHAPTTREPSTPPRAAPAGSWASSALTSASASGRDGGRAAGDGPHGQHAGDVGAARGGADLAVPRRR